MENFVGKRLDGRYEILEIIGVGGMAVVYKAYDNIEDRTVAIKFLKEEFMANEEFRRRFKNEMKAAATLSHPNIVKFYDASFGDRIQYIVTEYIDGITLKEYIEQQKVLNWKEAVLFTTQILRALQHAHDKGVVHRDIKPQNIMVLRNGDVKVTDFGVPRFNQDKSRTMSENAIGTVHYMSPEQARGALADGRSDLYSLGVVMYEMLTGQLPFQSDSVVSVAIMQLQSEAKKPREINPDIPIGLEQIVMKAMEKNPEERYQSAGKMLLALDEFAKSQYSLKSKGAYFDNPGKKKERLSDKMRTYFSGDAKKDEEIKKLYQKIAELKKKNKSLLSDKEKAEKDSETAAAEQSLAQYAEARAKRAEKEALEKLEELKQVQAMEKSSFDLKIETMERNFAREKVAFEEEKTRLAARIVLLEQAEKKLRAPKPALPERTRNYSEFESVLRKIRAVRAKAFEDGSIPGIMMDFAPTMAMELSIVERLSDPNIIGEFLDASDENSRRRVIFKSINYLTQNHGVRDDVATGCVHALASSLDWNIDKLFNSGTDDDSNSDYQAFLDLFDD